MDVTKHIEENKATLALTGRLDGQTSPELEKILASLPKEVTALVLDFKEIEYISSAGLRVLLTARKRFSGDALLLRAVRPTVMEVLRIAGLATVLNIENA